MPVWAQVIAAMGTLAVTVATTWWARGKTRAEAARTVTEAALQLITPQTDRIARLEEAVGEYQRRVGALERRERESIAALAVHAEWDAAVAVMAIGAGQPLPPMPPLFPDTLAHPAPGLVTAPTILSVVGVSIDGMDNTLVDPADPSDDLHEAAPVAGIDETDPVEIIEGDPDQVGEVAPDDAEPLPADAIAERLQGTDVVIDDLPTPGA